MNSEPPLWLIVTGPPASGKTTLARRIAQDLRIPLFEKDVLKDTLYEAMDSGDKDWSRQIGMAAINLLFLTANRMLRVGSSLVTESSFYRQLSSEQAGEIADSAMSEGKRQSAARIRDHVERQYQTARVPPHPLARGIIFRYGGNPH